MRVVTIDGDPWFVGKDVAGCLGYARERDALRKHVDEDDKKVGAYSQPSWRKTRNNCNQQVGIVFKNKDEADKPKTKEHSATKRVFKDLTDNKRINYSVLIATSWADVGINFKNRNITDIYCMFDDKYSRGDFTLIWQFMARAKDCRPARYHKSKQYISHVDQYL